MAENKCYECPHLELCNKMYPEDIKAIPENTAIDRIRSYYKQPVRGTDTSKIEQYVKELDGFISILRKKIFVTTGDTTELSQTANPRDVQMYTELTEMRLNLSLRLLKEEESNT